MHCVDNCCIRIFNERLFCYLAFSSLKFLVHLWNGQFQCVQLAIVSGCRKTSPEFGVVNGDVKLSLPAVFWQPFSWKRLSPSVHRLNYKRIGVGGKTWQKVQLAILPEAQFFFCLPLLLPPTACQALQNAVLTRYGIVHLNCFTWLQFSLAKHKQPHEHGDGLGLAYLWRTLEVLVRFLRGSCCCRRVSPCVQASWNNFVSPLFSMFLTVQSFRTASFIY